MPFYRGLSQALTDGTVTVFSERRAQGVEDALGTAVEFGNCTLRGFGRGASGKLLVLDVPKEAFDSDVVVLPWNARVVNLKALVAKAKIAGCRTLLWGHGVSQSQSRIRDVIRDFVATKSDGLVVYGQQAAKLLRARRQLRNLPIYVAPNALGQEEVIALSTKLKVGGQLREFQDGLGLVKGRTLLFVSRLLPENRVDLLLRAVVELSASLAGVKCVVVGDGPDRGRLEALALELGIAQQVLFVGAVYDEAKLAPYMLSSSAFCYPSNMGLSILHAFSYGLPVIAGDDATQHGPEFVALQDGRNGLKFRHGDVHGLVKCLKDVLGNQDLQGVLSAESLRTAQVDYSMTAMVRGFHDAIKSVALAQDEKLAA